MNDNRPWIEKYRPNKFEDIVLEDSNKTLLNTSFGHARGQTTR